MAQAFTFRAFGAFHNLRFPVKVGSCRKLNTSWTIKVGRQVCSLSLKQYEKLLEDLHDLALIAERKSEKPILLEEMKRRLGGR